MNYLRYSAICTLILLFLGCSRRDATDVAEYHLLAEFNKLKIQTFKDAVNFDLSSKEDYYVNIKKINGLDQLIRKELIECSIYGELNNPDGVALIVKSGFYYIPIKENKIPRQLANYRMVKLANGVKRVYRDGE